MSGMIGFDLLTHPIILDLQSCESSGNIWTQVIVGGRRPLNIQ